MKKYKKYPLYHHTARVTTLEELLIFCVKNYKERIAFAFLDNDKKIEISYSKFGNDVNSIKSYLHKENICNFNIALLGENSYSWIVTYFAVVCGKNIAVPLDKELTEEAILSLLVRSNSRVLFYDKKHEKMIEGLKKSLSSDMIFFSFDDIFNIISKGQELINNGYEAVFEEVNKDDIASIVYTSGTTGKSKGVMLTHNNFCSSMYGACCNVLLEGPSLLILPLHHTFGLVAAVFSVMFYGQTVCINRSLKRLVQDFQTFSPEHIFAVPLVVETLYKNIWNTAKRQEKEEKLKTAFRLSNFLLSCHIDLRKYIFKSIRKSFGGSFKLIVSGGAPIDEKYIEDFRSMGITVLNGYGITECGPIVSVNRNLSPVSGSVGPLLCCNSVKISENGEILVKGDNVMKGYYLDDKENQLSFTEDGWFKTGDIGTLEDDVLYITGRIKNLIILSNGENIPAESIENIVYTVPYVKEVIAYGENNQIVVEVFLDESYPYGEKTINKDIDSINRSLAINRNIGKVVVRKEEFPKTSTKKIIRNSKE